MTQYLKLTTPLRNDCEVREVTEPGLDGRRWHVKVSRSPGTGPSSFYLWASRHLPANTDENRIMRGVLNGVDGELIVDRSMMVATDYDSPLVPQDFER